MANSFKLFDIIRLKDLSLHDLPKRLSIFRMSKHSIHSFRAWIIVRYTKTHSQYKTVMEFCNLKSHKTFCITCIEMFVLLVSPSHTKLTVLFSFFTVLAQTKYNGFVRSFGTLHNYLFFVLFPNIFSPSSDLSSL